MGSSQTTPPTGPMLALQKTVPNLPIPTVESTAYKYLESAKPHLSESEYATTQAAVKEFINSDFVKTLQSRLQDRAAQPGVLNWLSEWWNDVAYMGYRDPVVVYVSYFYLHVLGLGEAWKPGDKPSRKAALLLKAILEFRKLVETQQLAPDKVKDTPLCMESYKWLFNSCRYPVKPSDTATKFPPEKNNHVIFIRNNRFFEVDTQLGENGEISLGELETQIDRIISLAGSQKGVPIGALTSENRDTWTEARKNLIVSPLNKASLERIESAILVVPLDSTSPSTIEKSAWTMWTGDGRNRFYDKHQLIVCDNGLSGWLGEHSCMDGTPTLRLNEFICHAIINGKITPTGSTASYLAAPKELKFDIDATTKRYIADAEKNFDKLIGDQELEVLHYTRYGAANIKKHKTSPDAFAQLVKQLAFYKLYQRPGVCYESCQTRRFQLGRTEVIRAASNESKAWVESMISPSSSQQDRFKLFQQAATRHIQYATWAAAAQGVDRHLFGLKRLVKEGESLPSLYTDKAFSATNHWELSTSQLSSPYFDAWGYGEVVTDGYGLSYAIGNDYVRWVITCLKTNTENRIGQPWKNAAAVKAALAEAADETAKMLEEGNIAVAKPKL